MSNILPFGKSEHQRDAEVIELRTIREKIVSESAALIATQTDQAEAAMATAALSQHVVRRLHPESQVENMAQQQALQAQVQHNMDALAAARHEIEQATAAFNDNDTDQHMEWIDEIAA